MDKLVINGETYIKESTFFEDTELLTCNQLAIKTFQNMGYEILTIVEGTANGPDMHIKKDNLVFRVEIKKARPSNRSMAVHPVEEARKHDDLIAIVFPSGYVLVEPMKDHLFSCAESGSRSFFGIY